MDIFKQNKILMRLVIILVVLNIALMAFFLIKVPFKKNKPDLFPNHDDYKDVSGILKDELGLSQEQTMQIEELRKSYFQREKILEEIIRNEKDSMNVEMFNETTNDQLLESLAKRISGNEFRMELIRMEQAKQLKKICTPQQLMKFEKLVLEIRDYFRPNNQPKEK